MNKKYSNIVFIVSLLTALLPGMDNGSRPRNITNAHSRPFIHRFRHTSSIMLTLILSMTVLMSLMPLDAQAAGGSYTLKWYSADPSLNNGPYSPTYAKLTPAQLACPGTAGRYADPLNNSVAYGPTSSTLDAVTSLAPKDMALGQIVPYEMVITVSGSTAPENGKIRFTTTFDTNTTSGDNFGFDPAYMVYCAFVDTADAGTNDPGNNAKVDNYTSTITGTGNNQKIQGTFNVSGLDSGDRIVVEIWVVLKSTIPAGSSGNVQTGLSSAQTATGDAISTGAQTVPLLRVREFFTGNADVSVTKTDSPDPVIQGQYLNYTLLVKNNSPDTVANGVVVNDTLPTNTTFVSASGASYIINSNIISFNVGALSPGQSVIINIVSQVTRTAWTNNDTSTDSEAGTASPAPTLYDVLNIVSETATTSDSNTSNNIYYQPTNVLLAHPFYIFDKKIIDVAGNGPIGNVTAAGNIITYQINVTNTGNIDLTNVTLNDSLINLTGPIGDNSPMGVLNVGETWTYTGSYTVNQEDINSNGGGTGVINNTATIDCDQLAPKSDTAEVPVHATPIYLIDKIVTDVAGNGSTGNITEAGQVISYRVNVTNAGNVDLTNVTLNDSLINLTGPSGDNAPTEILNVGETWTYTGSYTVNQEDINSNGGGTGVINNTATVDCDQLDPKSHSAEVPVHATPIYLIDKIVTDVAGNGSTGNITEAEQVISYRVNVTNAGNVDLTNVTLNDSLINLVGPSGDNAPTGILNVGEIWTYTGSYTVNQEDINSNAGGDGLINNTATVDCDQLDPKSHSAEVPIQGITAYTIDKTVTDVAGRGPTSSVTTAGDVISYRINVNNVGNVSLTNVILNDNLITLTGPSGDNLPTGTLDAGETWTYTGNYTVTQEDINSNGGGNGLIENTATVDCEQLDPKSHTAEVPLQVSAIYLIDKIVTDVAGKGPSGSLMAAGDVISYQINISNAGNTDLTNITVFDPLLGNLTGPVGDYPTTEVLNVGEVWIYTGNYTVTQEDINSNGGGDGLINNVGTVDCNELDPKNDSTEVPIKTPAYIIDKTIIDVSGKGPEGIVTSAGDIVTYQINVTNAGDVHLTNVSLNDSLIGNLIDPVESLNLNGILEVGETWIYIRNYTVTQENIDNYGTPDEDIDTGMEGDIDNTATVDCDQLDPKSHSAEVPLGTPVYMIDKIITDVAGKGSAGDVTAAGDIISYQVNVSNIGNLDLSNINITDSLMDLTGPSGDNSPTGILNVGETWIYRGNYTVTQADIDNTNSEGKGFIYNTATVDSTQLDPKNDSETASIVLPVSYNIDKIVKDVAGKGPDGNVTASGQTITYQINVTNTGQVNLTNVNVTDSLINLNEPTESINSDLILEIGEIWIYNATYTVNQTDISSNGGGDGFIENTATVDCDQLASKSKTTQVPIIQSASLTIEKSAYPPTYSSVGENITYTYNVNNTGNVGISAPINVTDNKTGTFTISNSGLAPGQNVTGTANYTITQADLDSGFVTNEAFATGTFNGTEVNSANVTATVIANQSPAYTIEKIVTDVAGKGPAGSVTEAGDIITYQIKVTNVGNVDLTNIFVTDPLIEDLSAPVESLITDGVLETGEVWVYTGFYTVTQADIERSYEGDGSIENIATVDCDQLESISDNTEVTIEEIPIEVKPEYCISKSIIGIDRAGDCILNKPGDIIEYRIVVKNEGNVDLTGITVRDPLIVLTGPTGDDIDPGVLNVGETWKFFGNYIVSLEDINSNGRGDGYIDNTAIVSCNGLPDAQCSISQPIAQKGDLCIFKSIIGVDEAGDCIVNKPGDVIQYQILVKNEGNIDLTGISVKDPLIMLTGPFGDDIGSDVLNKGETWKFFGNYTVTQADISSNGGGDGSIENTATVSCNELADESSIIKQPIIFTSTGGNGTASKPATENDTDSGNNWTDGSNNKGNSNSGSNNRESSGSSSSLGGSPEPAKNVEVKEIAQAFVNNGKSVKFDFTKNRTCVLYLGFDAKKNAGKITATVEMLKGKSALVSKLPSDDVYKSFNLWVGNSGFASSKSMENAIVCFKVEKSWIESKGIDPSSITLHRYSENKWDKHPTSPSGGDDKYLYFTANVPGFSPFVITGQEVAKETGSEIQIEPVNENIEQNVTGSEVEENTEKEENKSTPGFEIVYGMVSLLAIFLYKRK